MMQRGRKRKGIQGHKRPRHCYSSASTRAASIRSLSSSPIYTTISHQVGRGRATNTVFQAFRLFVSSVLSGCCKTRSERCIMFSSVLGV
jgi:hypothetical protein